MQVGDIVRYKGDWKPDRLWYLYSVDEEICAIVLLCDGKYTNYKNGEERPNSSIVNLNINEIEKV